MATRTAGISVKAAMSITAMAIASIGPMVFRLPDRARARAIMATMVVPALPAMDGPTARMVAAMAANLLSCNGSSSR